MLKKTFHVPVRLTKYAVLPLFLMVYKVYISKKRAYILAFNDTITNRIVTRLRPLWNHTPDIGIPSETIFHTFLIEKKPYVYTSNRMTGKIQNVNFQFCHVETSKSNGLAGRQPNVVFKGYFFEFDFPKYNKMPLHVHPPVMKDFSDILKIPTKISTDAKEFDHVFRTYCDDPVEMRYVLTMGLMARMIDLQKVLPGHVAFRFAEGKVFIAINMKGSTIEPKVDKRTSVESVEIVLRELFDMMDSFVEELKLQLDLWDKEGTA